GLTDYELQVLLFQGSAAEMRRLAGERDPEAGRCLKPLPDADVVRAFGDLGGHDLERVLEAYRRARTDTSAPYLIVAHTLKGWGLSCAAHPGNHSTLLEEDEVRALLEKQGLTLDDPFALFPEETPEGAYLAERRDRFRAHIQALLALREENRARVRARIAEQEGVPEALDIDTRMFPVVHTQWMWGQLASKLVRIGAHDAGGPRTGISSGRALTPPEARWKAAAELVLTLSPDVGTSTNISPVLD